MTKPISSHNNGSWLTNIEAKFYTKGIAGEDFFYLLKTMIEEGKITIPELLCQAIQGYGCTVHEGLSYSLDQDWDIPDLFDEVAIFVGEIQSSSLPIKDYIDLIKITANEYALQNSEVADSVLKAAVAIVDRYKRYLNQ